MKFNICTKPIICKFCFIFWNVLNNYMFSRTNFSSLLYFKIYWKHFRLEWPFTTAQGPNLNLLGLFLMTPSNHYHF